MFSKPQLSAITDGGITAVKAYHGDLKTLGIRPKRELAADSELTEEALSYAR